MSRLGVLFASTLVGVLGSALVASAATSPGAMRSSIVTAIRGQHWLDYVTTSTDPEWRSTMIGDIGRHRGIQRITIRRKGAKGRMTIVVVPGTAYLRGNVIALRDYWHYTNKQASRYAGRWISIPQGEFNYAFVAGDVTLRSFIADHVPQGRLTLVKGTVAGRQVVGLRGDDRVQIRTLYVGSPRRPLPIEETNTNPARGYKERIMIGPWNRPIHIHTPTHAVSDLTVLNS